MTKATTPCPQCYHTDEDHEALLRAREFARQLHERTEERRRLAAEEDAKKPKRFQCTCGHPGLGCYCRPTLLTELL